jgi:hypothetical protein
MPLIGWPLWVNIAGRMTTTADPPSTDEAPKGPELRRGRILKTWWPLAASWMLMGLEGPAISAVVSRLADPKINLAAYGGLVFPLALLVEAPIIMMLAASTALSRDWASFVKLRRFMNRMGAALTVIHIIMAATPVYYLLARYVIHAPEEIVGPGRIGLILMIPWTWSIAYRRFHQGILIRFGHSLKVGVGTGARLAADGLVLAAGYFTGALSGVAVASCALIAGVVTEAVYVHLAVRKTLKYELKPQPAAERPLTTRAMLHFYIPLSLTQLLVLIASPLGSAAMGRMAMPIESLAAWPVVNGVNFVTRGFGGAYNEVVVALVEEKRSIRALRRFAVGLSVVATALLVVLLLPWVASPVFGGVLGLADPLPTMVWKSLFLLLPMPALAVAGSYFQGLILYGRRTRSITESVAIFLAAAALILLGAVLWGTRTGLYMAVGALAVGELLRTAWLWLRSRGLRSRLNLRDVSEQAAVE